MWATCLVLIQIGPRCTSPRRTDTRPSSSSWRTSSRHPSSSAPRTAAHWCTSHLSTVTPTVPWCYSRRASTSTCPTRYSTSPFTHTQTIRRAGLVQKSQSTNSSALQLWDRVVATPSVLSLNPHYLPFYSTVEANGFGDRLFSIRPVFI